MSSLSLSLSLPFPPALIFCLIGMFTHTIFQIRFVFSEGKIGCFLRGKPADTVLRYSAHFILRILLSLARILA